MSGSPLPPATHDPFQNGRFVFTTSVKSADVLHEYIRRHNALKQDFAEVVRGLGVFVKSLSIYNIPKTLDLVMVVHVSPGTDFLAMSGEGSEYRKELKVQEWETTMCSYFQGDGWVLLDEVHSSEVEW